MERRSPLRGALPSAREWGGGRPSALPGASPPVTGGRTAPPQDVGLRAFLDGLAELVVEAVLRNRSEAKASSDRSVISPRGINRRRTRRGAERNARSFDGGSSRVRSRERHIHSARKGVR